MTSMPRNSGTRAQAHQTAMRQLARFEQHHQVGAAGERSALGPQPARAHRRGCAARPDRSRARRLSCASAGLSHGVEDLLIAGAAAEVAGESLADLLVGRMRDALEQTACAARIIPGVQMPHCAPP